MNSVGSLTKEFPLSEVDRTIGLIREHMPYRELRKLAEQQTHRDIPALLAHRFLLVRNHIIVRDRFLSFAEAEGLQAQRVR